MVRRLNKTTAVEELPPEIKRKLKAVNEIAGLLNDLPPEELKAFMEATKRRPLFETKASE